MRRNTFMYIYINRSYRLIAYIQMNILHLKVVHDRKGNDVLHLHISKKIMIFIAILAPYMAMCLTFYLWKEGKDSKRKVFN